MHISEKCCNFAVDLLGPKKLRGLALLKNIVMYDHLKNIIITLLFAVMATLPLWAQTSGSCGVSASWNLRNDTLIISGSGPMFDWNWNEAPWSEYAESIQAVDIDSGIIKIGNCAFVACSNLTSITLPNSITSIGNSAFGQCQRLAYIQFSARLTSIGDGVFEYCNSLTSITIPATVIHIGDGAFPSLSLASIVVELGNQTYDSRNNCNAIIETATNKLIFGCKNTIIPNSVTTIGYNAFFGCAGLTTINFPHSVTNIEFQAFRNCTGLTSLFIPNSVTNIAEGAFSTIPAVTSIVVESGNPRYDSRNNCNAIIESASRRLINGCTNTIIPDSITCIGEHAFEGCSELTTISIPNTVTCFEFEAFRGCSGLTSITIPNSVTTLNPNVFVGCGLTSIIIPRSVTYIGSDAFTDCNSLDSVIFINPIPPTIQCTSSFSGTQYYFYVPCGSVSTYIAALNRDMCYGYEALTIDASRVVETLGFPYVYNIVSADTSLGNVVITQEPTCANPTMVILATANENHTFLRWSDGNTNNPRSIVVTQDTSFVAEFERCYIAEGTCGAQLTWKLYCDSVLEISGTGPMADWNSDTAIPWYSYRSAIISVVVDSGVTTIGRNAFSGCEEILSLVIPNGVTSIGDWAFYMCHRMESVTIPNSVTSIGDFAFYACSGFSSFIFSNNVTSIGGAAFYATDFTSVFIPASVTYIGQDAFSACGSLISIIVDANNTTYDSRNNCNAIIETATNKLIIGCNVSTIPNGVAIIGAHAFWACGGLASITIPNSVTNIEGAAFYACGGLLTISIPNSVTTIDGSAFVGCNSLSSVIIGSGIISIGEEAFSDCIGLASFTFTRPTPPAFHSTGCFYNTTCDFYVPCLSKEAYVAALNDSIARGYTIANSRVIQDTIFPYVVTLAVSEPASGAVSMMQEPTCDDPTLIIQATAAEHYHFVCWSDGNTTNPRTMTLDRDSTITAIFALDYKIVSEPVAICETELPYVWHGIDFYIPQTYRDTIQSSTGLRDSIVILDLSVAPTITTSFNDTICDGDSYIWEGISYTAAGNYTKTLQTIYGCDSVVTLHLSLWPKSPAVKDTAWICAGESYIWEGGSYDAAGDYTKTFQTIHGCDSVVMLHLKTTLPPTLNVRPDTMIHVGDSALLWATGAEYLRWSPDSAIRKTSDDKIYAHPTVTTTYTVTGYNLDPSFESNLVYNGDFNLGNVGFTTQLNYFTPYSTIGGWGDYTITDNVKGFWSLSQTPSVKAYNGSGYMMVVDGKTTPNSIVWQQQVRVVPNTYYAYSAEVMSCWESNIEGQYALLQFAVNGVQIGPILHSPSVLYSWVKYYEIWYSGNNTIATLTILNQNNNGFGNDFAIDEIRFEPLSATCEATENVTITIIEDIAVHDTVLLCDTELPYIWHDKTFTSNQHYRDTILSNAGVRDSVVILDLYVFSSESTSLNDTICYGETYRWEGSTLTEGGSYTKSLTTIHGCDSVVTLFLTVLPSSSTSFNDTVYGNQPYSWEGEIYNTSGTYTKTRTNIYGCDSVITLHLTVYSENLYDLTIYNQCAGDGALEMDLCLDDRIDQLNIHFDGALQDTMVSVTSSHIVIPYNNARAGHYTCSIDLLSHGKLVRTVSAPFTLFYPSTVLEQAWNDVMAVLTHDYNGGYDFVSFQWYENGDLLVGETHSYLYRDLTIGAEYSALLTDVNGLELMTCPLVATPQVDISLYPTVAERRQEIRCHVSESTMYTLYDETGHIYESFLLDAGDNTIYSPLVSGIYLARLKCVNSDIERTIKVIVK